jgi:hypothetical protein
MVHAAPAASGLALVSETPAAPASRRRTDPRVRRTLLLMAAIVLAPVAASYSAYYFWPRDKHVNYGELLATEAPALEGAREDGNRPFRLADLRGKWVIVTATRGGCDASCERALYATRQARTIQGRDQPRIARVLVVTGAATPTATQLSEHPGLEVVRATPSAMSAFPAGGALIYLIDPLGNLVLAWPADPDIKALAKDLGRLLRASRIG